MMTKSITQERKQQTKKGGKKKFWEKKGEGSLRSIHPEEEHILLHVSITTDLGTNCVSIEIILLLRPTLWIFLLPILPV